MRFLNIFKFLSFGHLRKRLDKKAKVNVKIYVVTARKQIIAIHILPNMSINKGNQTMKFGQLIEYHVGNMFVLKSCRR